jgi:hypothetical protein
MTNARWDQIDRIVEAVGTWLMVGVFAFMLGLPIAVLWAVGNR